MAERMQPPITSWQVAATVIAGTAALILFGLQPLLFAAYVKEGILGQQSLGLLSAVEVLTIAAFSALAVRLNRQFRVQWIAHTAARGQRRIAQPA